MPPSTNSKTENSNPILVDRIVERLQAQPQQRVPFVQYMDWVLYEPQYGYYAANRAKIGAAGDFFTAPHVSHDFGELLAEQFQEMWQRLGYPVPFTLVEMGAGQGIIAADVLTYARSHHPDFFQALRYRIVEKAAAHIAEQQQRLQAFTEAGKLQWLELAEIRPNSITGCFFSNELVDALPVHRVVLENQQLREIFVQVQRHDSGAVQFQEVIDQPSTERLVAYFDLVGIELTPGRYPEGYRSEVNLAALDWLQEVAARLERGYVLTIDYGYPAVQYYSPGRNQGTLQCYYQHSFHDDPYLHIGRQDLTAHVDFTALERWGERWGLETLGFTQQGLFLMALGLGDRLVLNNSGQQATSAMDVIRRREALHLLINPMGLGGFGVLIQTKGMEAAKNQPPLRGLRQPA